MGRGGDQGLHPGAQADVVSGEVVDALGGREHLLPPHPAVQHGPHARVHVLRKEGGHLAGLHAKVVPTCNEGEESDGTSGREDESACVSESVRLGGREAEQHPGALVGRQQEASSCCDRLMCASWWSWKGG